MDDNAKTNLVNKFYDTIVKRTNKERRENLIPPTPKDFFECWLLAIEMAKPVILKPRKPGRPPKKDATVVNEDDFIPIPRKQLPAPE